ncbi:DUF2092 domain-containing protein [Aliikangiella marina]|uniref:DUF2092 domain-containing protein n=1 Tax=Aliikangiella marina TaxID=1712262 RepID=A0A545T1F3_9GAMM|nr:DUF2092 domain-containing protein [Aliikangiella marina]TQV71058.1 DUF2092 domain-containing protein [Aliikangiella marina]
MNQNQPLDPKLDSTLQQMKALEPDEATYQAMEDRLLSAIEQHAHSHSNIENDTTDANQRTFFEVFKAIFQPQRILAGGLATLAFVVSSLLLFTSNTQSAFAQVISHLQNINTMQYQANMIANGNPLMSLKVLYKTPDKVRVETTPASQTDQHNPAGAQMINIIHSQHGKGLTLIPAQKFAIPFAFSVDKAAQSIEQNPLHWFELAKEFKGEAEYLGTDVVNAQNVEGFRFANNDIVISIWANTETNMPVRFAMSSDNGGDQPIFTMQADLELNISIEESLFSLEIPADYTLVGEDKD